MTFILLFFLGCLFWGAKSKTEIVKADLLGYSTKGTDQIVFRVKGVNCNRPADGISEKVNEEGKLFYKNYDVELTIRQSFQGIYLIEKINLVKK